MADFVTQIKKLVTNMGTWEWLTLVAIFFVFMLFLASRASGWHKLAKQYPNLNGSHPEWISMPDFFDKEGLGGMTVDFNNSQTDAINLAVDREGMYLSMSSSFRLFHPPVFIPWDDVRSVAQGPPWSDQKHEIRFTFALCPDVPLDVDLEVAREIEKRAEGRWTMPQDVSPKRTSK